MARVRNKQPRVITLPNVRCETDTDRMVKAPSALAPGVNEVEDLYLIHALAMMPDDDDDFVLFTIHGKQEGHRGILALFSKRGPLELLDEDEVDDDPIFPDLSGERVSEAVKIINKCIDKAILHHWYHEETRKGCLAAIKARAKALGLELE